MQRVIADRLLKVIERLDTLIDTNKKITKQNKKIIELLEIRGEQHERR